MYSRSFQPPKEEKYGNIPVQSFEDSFSADAFLKEKKAAQKALPEREEETGAAQSSLSTQSSLGTQSSLSTQSPLSTQNALRGELSAGKTPQALRPDDLLLLILLLVFLSDARKSGDKILPLLFAALLLS